MTRRSAAIVLLLASLVTAVSAATPEDEPRLLTTVAQVRSLTLQQARQRYPIHLKGIITYRAPEYQVTFASLDARLVKPVRESHLLTTLATVWQKRLPAVDVIPVTESPVTA